MWVGECVCVTQSNSKSDRGGLARICVTFTSSCEFENDFQIHFSIFTSHQKYIKLNYKMPSFPGGSVVKNPPNRGEQAQSLVQEDPKSGRTAKPNHNY